MLAGDEDVARVHVGVEEAVTEHLGKEDFDAAFGQFLHVSALVCEGGQIGHWNAVDPLHHQHLVATPVPVDAGDIQQLGALEVAPQLRGIGGFAVQVQLVEDGLFVILDHLDRAQTTTIGRNALQQACGQKQPLDILIDGFANTRTNHLDHHLTAIFQAGSVDLGYRGGGQRLVAELGEDILNALTELLLNPCAGPGAGEGRYLVLQTGQFKGDVFGQQVAAGRQNLAELDEYRAEVFAGLAQPRATAQVARGRSQTPGAELQRQARQPRQRQCQQDLVQTVAGEDMQDAQQARKGGESHASGESGAVGVSNATRASRRSSCRRSACSCSARARASAWPTS